MAQLSKDIIGKKLDPYSITVERGKIKEFCLAIGETNPLYFDIEVARKAGYDDIPIPLTFQTSFMFWGYPKIWDDMRALGIDTDRLLHLKEEYTFIKQVVAGMEVMAVAEISDVKTGKMEMATFKTVYKTTDGQDLIAAEMSIVIRPEDS